ncbi:histone-lysine N-methyltransferase SETMAR-like [Haliotis rufescens]|uniref:histone-lysine N-methyltransferase SETMAR-like n=1 Tax=Haliotis rufescens TaxID=6454 RepID=UPI00201F9FFC|nr:histone-lysine N-methyltransferase SETMAR-like [Haliotis rufescens]
MDKSEYRAVIKFLVLEDQSAKKVEERLTAVYGESSTIKRWVKEFQRGRESLEDDARSGRPSTSTSPENIDTVHKLVMVNRRITLHELEETTGLSYGSIHNIIHGKLHMSKVCARWVSRMLTDDMKLSRVTISGALLTRYNANPDDFHFRIVTSDETWVYHYDPESKQESMELKHPTSPKTKTSKATRSTKKVMMSIFWESKGVTHIDYLPHGTTINGEYYALLKQVHQSIKVKPRGKIRRGILLHQDNAPVHTSRVAMTAVPHPHYSPDLAPSDFHLFPRMKKLLRGQRFEDDDELAAAVEGWLGDQNVDFYRSGISDWQTRWNKCVELGGDYVEK